MNNPERKIILITGNLGYIGGVVLDHLREVEPGALLVGLDCGYFAHCLSDPSFVPEVLLQQQQYIDVRDVDDDILTGVSAIVHLAAISNDPMGVLYQEVTNEINYLSTIDIARRAKAAGVSAFIFASSCSMYGAGGTGLCDEKVPLNPLTPYARSKASSEKDLEKLADSEFLVTCLRFPTACGISKRLRLDLVLNDFVASAYTCDKIEVLSDGSPWRPLIDVRDMARAIGWGVKREQSVGGKFLAVNVGRKDCNYRIREIAELVARACGDTKVSINQSAGPDSRSYRVDFSLFHALAPDNLLIHDIESSIESLRTGLKRMSFNEREFRNSKWMRLIVLKTLEEQGYLDSKLRWMI